MPRAVWIALQLLTLVALAGCSSPPPPPPAPPPMPMAAPPPPPPAAPTASSDQEFINVAMGMNASEVGMGRLARGKAAGKPVKALAGRMVSDHTRANQQLAGLAKRLKIEVAPAHDEPPPELAAASGPDFDKQYVAMTIKAHQDAIALYESEANGGQDARAKHLARSTLPALRRHLHEAEALGKKLGM